MRIILNGVIDADWSEHFQETRAIADDLTVIEHETKARFRYPATLTGLDRVNIRNVRLILEGHVVAHPIDNQIGAKINGEFDPTTLEVLLNGQPGWIKWQSSPGHVMVLGEVIELPEHAVGGPARLSEDNLAAVRAAIDHGSTDGMPLTFRLDPDDRLRIWMPGDSSARSSGYALEPARNRTAVREAGSDSQ